MPGDVRKVRIATNDNLVSGKLLSHSVELYSNLIRSGKFIIMVYQLEIQCHILFLQVSNLNKIITNFNMRNKNFDQFFYKLALICALRAPMFCHIESAILISPIARFDFDNSRSTHKNRLYLECSIYIRDWPHSTTLHFSRLWILAIGINYSWMHSNKYLGNSTLVSGIYRCVQIHRNLQKKNGNMVWKFFFERSWRCFFRCL